MKFIKFIICQCLRIMCQLNNYLVKYSLETEMLMVSEDRTKFSLLSENTYQLCNGYHYQFCNSETAFYQTNSNKFCVMALFMQNQRDITTLCKRSIVLDQKLPITKYLSFGLDYHNRGAFDIYIKLSVIQAYGQYY